MRKFLRSSVIFISLVLALLSAFSGCNTYKKPASKQVLKSVDLFSAFGNYGFVPEGLVINKDYSGYMTYYIPSTTVAQQKNSIATAIEDVNKNTTLTYSEGDYQAGYRAVYVNDEYIKQEGSSVSVRVEFTNINYLSTPTSYKKVCIQTLEEYLKENTDSNVNNNFRDAGTGEPSSVIKIEDKQKTCILTLKNVANKVPVKLNGSNILCYHIENPNCDYAEVKGDTVTFSTANIFIVYAEAGMPLWLIISVCFAAGAFLILLAYKIIFSRRR